MDSTALRDLFRSEMVDVETPTLWSDDEVFNYIDDAQKMFCRLVNGINDAMTPAVTQLAVSTTSDTVATSPLILKPRNAYLVSDGSKIDIVNFEDMRRLGLRFDGRKGPVRMLIIGMTDNVAKMYPFPTVADTIQLLVERLPLKTIDGESQVLEVAAQHHPHLLLWAKHRAYLKQDAETRDDKKAVEMEASFRTYCEAARKEKERAMHKTRVVVYGGIGGSIGDTGARYDSRGRSTNY